MSYLCPHQCEGKTEYGYCRYTWCINPLHSNLGTAYQGQGVQKAIITNADRIRSMTDEELAEFIGDDAMHGICPNNCQDDLDRPCRVCALDWLKQECAT